MTETTERRPTLLERVDQHESNAKQLADAMNQLHGMFEKHAGQQRGVIQNILEILNAVITLQGEGFDQHVQNEVLAARERRAKEQLAKAQAVLQNLIDNKVVEPAETISSDSILVGKELDSEGKPAGLGDAQVRFADLTSEMQGQLTGKGVGASCGGTEGRFEVTAIYKPTPTPPPDETTTPAEAK